jgi:Helix-turn-helix domain
MGPVGAGLRAPDRRGATAPITSPAAVSQHGLNAKGSVALVAAGVSCRQLAARLGRAPSTVSRELARSGGRHRYRAQAADAAALQRAQRPKAAKLASQPAAPGRGTALSERQDNLAPSRRRRFHPTASSRQPSSAQAASCDGAMGRPPTSLPRSCGSLMWRNGGGSLRDSASRWAHPPSQPSQPRRLPRS